MARDKKSNAGSLDLSSLSLTGSNFQEDAFLKEITFTATCANCLKTTGDRCNRSNSPTKFMTCSACKSAAYCSKECQVKHWKEHKPKCLYRRQAKQVAKGQNQKRELRLMQDWKDAVRNGMLEYVLLQHFGVARLQALHNEEDPSKLRVVVLQVQFDYNRRTFVPTEAPSIALLEDIESEFITKATTELYQDLDSKTDSSDSNSNINVVVLLHCPQLAEMASLMPMKMIVPNQRLSEASWDDLMNMLGRVRLNSRKFQEWELTMQVNVKQQLQSLQLSPHFQPFLVNALRIETKASTQRHKTHIVFVDMKMGYGLGQVQRLLDYKLVPVETAVSELSSLQGDLLTPQQLQHYQTHIFDLEHSPKLLQSRTQRPYICLLPIVFVDKMAVAFVVPTMSEVYPDHNVGSVAKCDKKARQSFAQLQKIPFPTIVSPSLE